jgi:hypothetical protein
MSTQPVVRSASGAANRIADVLLQVVGGTMVQVRIYTQSAAGDGGQVGQPSPAYQDYPLGPAVFRRITATLQKGEPNRYELLVSSTAVANLVTSLALASAEELFDTALGIVVDGSVRLIEGLGSSEAFGSAYLYTLKLRDQ